jgi:hypothetical protein
MTHHCHALGCPAEVRPTLLMCAKHWALVPVDLRMSVVRNYRRGQCDDKRPSKEWLAAARKAIQYVAAYEKGLI